MIRLLRRFLNRIRRIIKGDDILEPIVTNNHKMLEIESKISEDSAKIAAVYMRLDA